MSSYVPSEPSAMAFLASILAAIVVGGHALAWRVPPAIGRPLAWATLVLGTLGVSNLVDREPPGVRMVALIAFALLVMKVIVVIEERVRGMAPLTWGTWLAFALGWLGMRPRLFAPGAKPRPLPGTGALLRRGTLHTMGGVLLVLLARLSWTATQSRLLASVLLLPGLSLILHFGLCNILAGLWRLRGTPCDALFRAPLRSQNLAEFWARRWNLAFSEMTAIAVYRPLAGPLGRGPALLAGFMLSGLLHELAISVPVRAGFGLPLLYFLIHGALVLFERGLADAGRALSGWTGRVWALFWLAAPLPLLFHRPFLAGVVWPLIGMPPGW